MRREKWTDEILFERILRNKSNKTYQANIIELRSRDNRNVFERSFALANSNVAKERIIGVDLLSQLGSPPRKFFRETIKLYFQLLKTEKDSRVLQAIFYGIAQNNQALTHTQTAAISPYKGSPDFRIRSAVGYALLHVENEIAINTLIFLSNDKVVCIRDWATFSLQSQIEKYTERIREALWNRVEDTDQDTRFEAILGLAKRKDKRVNTVVMRELQSGNFGTLLFEAITELKDKSFLPVLLRELEQSENDETVDLYWLACLKECIDGLEQIPKNPQK